MVYNAGNYNTAEFAKAGAPFQLWLLLVASVVLAYRKQWQAVWIASFVAAACLIGLAALWTLIPRRCPRP